MNPARRFAITAAAVACLTCCAPADEPAADAAENAQGTEKADRADEAATTDAAGKSGSVEVGDFTFTFAAPWTKAEPRNRMIAASVRHGEGDDAPVAAFYYFGKGQGGSTRANIDRWIGQFNGEPKVETTTVEHDGTKITYVFATGTYLSGSPFGAKTPMNDYALHGAIIEGESAPVFIKMTGPEKTLEETRDAFKQLAASPFAK